MRPGAATVLVVLLLTACSGLPGNFKDPDIKLDRVVFGARAARAEW